MTLGNVKFSCSKIPPKPHEIIIDHDPYHDGPFVALLEHSIIHAYSLESSPTWFWKQAETSNIARMSKQFSAVSNCRGRELSIDLCSA